jgi:hypothetical protein
MEKKFFAVKIKFIRNFTLTICYGALNWGGMETKTTAVEISLGLNSTWFLSFCRLKFWRMERRPTAARRGSNVSCEVHDSRPKRAEGLPHPSPLPGGDKKPRWGGVGGIEFNL